MDYIYLLFTLIVIYLGIIITNDLSVSTDVTNIVWKAHHRANVIYRCFASHNINLLVCAFVTCVRVLCILVITL